MSPVALNFDSAFDWTPDVLEIWEQIDWEHLHAMLGPAIRNEETISGLAARFGVHPTMVNNSGSTTRNGLIKPLDI
jgi:hypothetical protein